ncbi:MAG: hypothetical protein IIW67_01745, partial [Peptococcaceae bacterium]|nr:hypothetical protein [Peptococcaceae bacterium]
MTTYNEINVSSIENRTENRIENSEQASKHNFRLNFIHHMKQNIKWMTVFGLLLPITWLGST